VIKNSLIK
jgi:hypothetical protein